MEDDLGTGCVYSRYLTREGGRGWCARFVRSFNGVSAFFLGDDDDVENWSVGLNETRFKTFLLFLLFPSIRSFWMTQIIEKKIFHSSILWLNDNSIYSSTLKCVTRWIFRDKRPHPVFLSHIRDVATHRSRTTRRHKGALKNQNHDPPHSRRAN